MRNVCSATYSPIQAIQVIWILHMDSILATYETKKTVDRTQVKNLFGSIGLVPIIRVNVSSIMNGKMQSENIDLSNADIWDDTLLIKAYDESLKLAKEEVAKRIARSTNTQKTTDSGEDTEMKQSQRQYKTGDYVRATYEDGLDYEAKIISIDLENCLVRFVGYENEETVELKDLVSSWGKKARKTQMRNAMKCLSGDKTTKEHVNRNVGSGMQNYNAMQSTSVPIPPPPPMPPMLNDTSEDSENMSAMLMSWYMSGYYTGYYQGQKEAQNKIQKK